MPINQFKINIVNIENLIRLYNVNVSLFPNIQDDLGDILRASWVFSIAALDSFIHDIVRKILLDVYSGSKSLSIRSDQINLTFEFLLKSSLVSTSSEKMQLLQAEIMKNESKISYQSPATIETKFSYLGYKSIWQQIGAIHSIPAQDIRNELNTVVYRRNKIAHEGDYDYTTGSKISIDVVDAVKVKELIEKICFAIEKIVI